MRSKLLVIRRVVLATALPMLAALVVMLIGCSTTPQPMHSAAAVPASEGTVKATKGSNDNTNVEVLVKHLAPPAKVAADSTIYVVWVQPMNGALQNVGALILNSDLDGGLKTVTPFHRFKLTVTPEPSAAIMAPSHDAVFTADVERTE